MKIITFKYSNIKSKQGTKRTKRWTTNLLHQRLQCQSVSACIRYRRAFKRMNYELVTPFAMELKYQLDVYYVKYETN